MSMNYRRLGNTGIELSEIGYGAAGLFGKDVFGKQGIRENQAYDLIYTAIKHGVTFFDTGINYGYAEERLGRCLSNAIREGITDRSKLVIETKCGETINPDGSYGIYDWSPDWIKRSLDISLKRLQLDYLDLFAMHGGGIAECSDSLIHTFQDMKSQRLIKAYGINTFDDDVLNWVAENKIFDYVMLDYNIMRQDREPLIEKLVGNGVAVIAGSALGESLYSKRVFKVYNRNDLWYLGRALKKFRNQISKGKRYRFINNIKGITGSQIALSFVLDNSNITSALFGTTSIEHMIENIEATEKKMPVKLKQRIRDIGFR